MIVDIVAVVVSLLDLNGRNSTSVTNATWPYPHCPNELAPTSGVSPCQNAWRVH